MCDQFKLTADCTQWLQNLPPSLAPLSLSQSGANAMSHLLFQSFCFFPPSIHPSLLQFLHRREAKTCWSQARRTLFFLRQNNWLLSLPPPHSMFIFLRQAGLKPPHFLCPLIHFSNLFYTFVLLPPFLLPPTFHSCIFYLYHLLNFIHSYIYFTFSSLLVSFCISVCCFLPIRPSVSFTLFFPL